MNTKAVKLILGIILLVLGLIQTLSSMLHLSLLPFIVGMIMMAGGFLLCRV